MTSYEARNAKEFLMKTWVLGTVLVLSLVAVIVVGRRTPKITPPVVLSAHVAAVVPVPSPVLPPAPSQAAVTQASPLAQELEALLGTFTPSWPEHEEAAHLAGRRAQIAKLIAEACADEFPTDAATARKYAITLAFIGQRETRFAEKPNLLGNQDDSAAHGYWQIHEWKKQNPYSAATAVNMLHEGPDSWALPKATPWVGLPKAAEYLRTHP